jgi:4-amino-4-deoxy-L-arabinose transferase-like glycosyltransferase
MPLTEPDEARYSAIPSAMNATGDYVTPRLKGTVYLEKPPLCYWATALSFKIFGENEFSARLFSALCAWGCILLVYSIGSYHHGAKTGCYAAAVLATSLFHFILGRMNILDMPLAFFASTALWCGYRHFAGGETGKTQLYLLYLFSAFAFLAKGLIGVVFPFSILVLWLSISRRWRDLPKIFSPVGVIAFFAVAGPWLALVQMANRDFLWFFFIQEHFLRYATSGHGKHEPFYFFIPILIAGAMPWCAFLLKALKERKTMIASLFQPAEKAFLLTWAGFIFLFFTVSSSKLVPYVAPVFLPLAVFLGHIFRVHDDTAGRPGANPAGGGFSDLPVVLSSVLFVAVLFVPPFLPEHGVPLGEWWPWVIFPAFMQVLILFLPGLIGKRWNVGWFATVCALTFLFFGSLIFPLSQFLAPYKSAHPLVAAIQEHVPPGREVYQYGMSLYGIDFYGRSRTPVVEDIGELRPGVEKLIPEERNHYFLSYDTFQARLQQEKEVFCAVKYKNIERLKKEVPLLSVLWNNGYYYLLHLKTGN